MDRNGPKLIRVFESAWILMYLAEKFGAFVPTEAAARAECRSWLFWQMGAAPYLGGGFGHFYAYAPIKIEYAIDRFAMEVKRQLDVLDRRLADNEYLAGQRIHYRRHGRVAVVRRPAKGEPYGSAAFLRCRDTSTSTLGRQIAKRPAVSAAAWSTAPAVSLRASCTSATMPPISRQDAGKIGEPAKA